MGVGAGVVVVVSVVVPPSLLAVVDVFCLSSFAVTEERSNRYRNVKVRIGFMLLACASLSSSYVDKHWMEATTRQPRWNILAKLALIFSLSAIL